MKTLLRGIDNDVSSDTHQVVIRNRQRWHVISKRPRLLGPPSSILGRFRDRDGGRGVVQDIEAGVAHAFE